MQFPVPHIGGSDEHVPPQLALNSNIPRLRRRSFGRRYKLAQGAAAGVPNGRSERARWRIGDGCVIPFAPTRDGAAVSIRGQVPHQPLAVVVSHLIDPELKGAAVQRTEGNSTEDYGLAI